MRRYCYLLLTCADEEKERLAKLLLDKKLIVCAKFLPVEAMYLWQGAVERDGEVLVVMESAEDLFAEVEAELAKVHSYDTFVLQAVPVTRTSSDATKWMQENLKEAARNGS